MEAEERDVTIGPGKLLGLFFMLVVICGVFFAIGYSLGKTSAREQALNDKAPLNASLAPPIVGDASAPKPSAVVPAKSEPDAKAAADQEKEPTGPDLTFFNAVKKSEGAAKSATDEPKATAVNADPAKTVEEPVTRNVPPAATTTAPTNVIATNLAPKTEATASVNGAFVVQIAAGTREEDAAALAGALRKKNYSVFVVNNPSIHDKFYHVQVGPFATLQDAEAMKAKLTGEGYNPIVKKS